MDVCIVYNMPFVWKDDGDMNQEDSWLGKEQNAIMERINYLMYEFDAVYHEASLKFGISDSVSVILYTICNFGDSCFLSDLVKYSGISKQTINSALRKMEQEKLIRLEAYDGRKKIIYLTEQGRVLAERTVMRLIAQENAMFDAWSVEDKEKLLELMQRYIYELKTKVKEL